MKYQAKLNNLKFKTNFILYSSGPQAFHPPINQYHKSHARDSVGQISETLEFNDDRKFSISGNYKLFIKFMFLSKFQFEENLTKNWEYSNWCLFFSTSSIDFLFFTFEYSSWYNDIIYLTNFKTKNYPPIKTKMLLICTSLKNKQTNYWNIGIRNCITN